VCLGFTEVAYLRRSIIASRLHAGQYFCFGAAQPSTMFDSVPGGSSARTNEELLQFELGQVFGYLMFVFA
jgi:hypothetical protein